jgi:hypothetical protein
MGEMLTELVSAGLVTKLDGQDDRLDKMSRAVNSLVKDLRKNRQLLIPAILTGLNANATAHDAMILKAEKALQSEWPTMASVHTDRPISLYRTLLLDACQQVGDGANAAVIWYTAADTLIYSPLDRETNAVWQMLQNMARRAEKAAVAGVPHAQDSGTKPASDPRQQVNAGFELPRVDREHFELKISAALGGTTSDNKSLTNANRYWPGNNQHWVYDAVPRLQAAISEQIDKLAKATEEQMAEVETYVADQVESFKETAQQAVAKARDASTSERQRLDALWWFETLYSTSLHCSYRELDNELAAVVMAYDLLSLVPGIMPASLPHLLAEGVNRLPGASFRDKFSIETLLSNLKMQRARLPGGWIKSAKPALPDVRLSLRDVALTILTDTVADIKGLLGSAAIPPDTEMSLPEFGRAVLRQEHAVRLAAMK